MLKSIENFTKWLYMCMPIYGGIIYKSKIFIRGRKVMRKRLLKLLLVTALVGISMTACSFEKTCKESGCDETELYKDDYCKYHYHINAGEDLIKDIVN